MPAVIPYQHTRLGYTTRVLDRTLSVRAGGGVSRLREMFKRPVYRVTLMWSLKSVTELNALRLMLVGGTALDIDLELTEGDNPTACYAWADPESVRVFGRSAGRFDVRATVYAQSQADLS